MTLLDRYVGRIVAGAFGAGMLFFLFLMIVLDLLSNVTRYLNHASRSGVDGWDFAIFLGEYYLKWLPVLATMITPFVTVIACMFAVARLQGANEIVPMLFVGRSVQRILRPMLFCGLLAGLGMAACWQWVIPQVGGALAEASLLLQDGRMRQKNLVLEASSPERIGLYVGEYEPTTRSMRGLRQIRFPAEGAEPELVIAAGAQWQPERGDWQLQSGILRSRQGEHDLFWLQRPDLTPDVLLQRGREQVDPDALSYTDLRLTIAARPNRPDLKLAFHRHITYPLANLVLLLLALPLAVHFERGGRMGRLLLAIALCAGYTLVDLAFQSLGKHGFVHPVVAAWSPTLVFGSLGLVLFGGARS